MQNISCTVGNCSHNSNGTCYANRINVGGKGVTKSENTCCGSFLDEAHYSTLTNNTNDEGPCSCIVCEAQNCQYNNNKLCTAETIQVNGNQVNVYNETNCATFKLK